MTEYKASLSDGVATDVLCCGNGRSHALCSVPSSRLSYISIWGSPVYL